MPYASPCPCTSPCHGLVRQGTCSVCGSRGKRTGPRGSSAQRGYGSRWRRFRAQHLRQHPHCVRCQQEGRQTPAVDLDHVTPVYGKNDSNFFRPDNVQGLCKRHHAAKHPRGYRGAW